MMTDESGDVRWEQDYMPFGDDLPLPGMALKEWDADPAYKYTGQRQVAGIGLYYYGARFYDPELGRFITEDTYAGALGDAQTQNRYCYVLNNPMRYVDPTGHSAEDVEIEDTDSGGLCDSIKIGWDWVKEKYNEMLNLKIHGLQGPGGHYANLEMAYAYMAFKDQHPEWEANGYDIIDYGFMTGQIKEITVTAKDLDFLVSFGLTLLGLDNFKDFADLAFGKSVVSGEKLTTVEKMLILLPFVSTAMVKGAKMAINAVEVASTTRIASKIAKYDEGIEAIYEQVTHGANAAGGASKSIDLNKIIDSAIQPKKGGETILGHALQKHAGRNPDIWGKVKGGLSQINETALGHLNDILKGPGEFKVFTTDKGVQFLEKMLPDGRGVRLNMDGTFKGFIDQVK